MEVSEAGQRDVRGKPTASRPVGPAGIAGPAAGYAHGTVTDRADRWLHTSGVLPVRPDGSVPSDIAEQARAVWRNTAAILAEVGMAATDIVSITTYVVPGQDLGAVMEERDRFMAGHLAASTLVVVPELAQPAWKLEIAVIAAAHGEPSGAATSEGSSWGAPGQR